MASFAGPSERVCNTCGGRLVEDDSGSMSMLLCESCGAVVADQQLVLGGDNATDSANLPDLTRHSLGALSQKVRGQEDTGRKREKAFIDVINLMASNTQLRGRDLQMCKEEGLQLLRNTIRFQRVKFVAAGLVFIALKRQTPAITFKEVSQLTDVGIKPLGRMVRWLKKQLPTVIFKQAKQECTFIQSIERMLDQLKLPTDKMSETMKVAKDLKLVLHGTLERPLTHSRGGDGAILILALNHVYRDNPQSETWNKLIADLVQIKMLTLRSRVSSTKQELLSVAANIPSLEPRIKEKVISARSIHKYIPYLLDNKSYLVGLSKASSQPSLSNEDMSDNETEEDGGVAVESCDPTEAHLPSMYHQSTILRRRRKERAKAAAERGTPEKEVGESCSDLDDSELGMYIATEKEVREKERYFKKHQIT